MAVSVAAMTLAELQAWMALHPIYVTVGDAIAAGALVATPAAGMSGVAITVAGETAVAVDATVTGATIIDFAEAADLLSKGRVVRSGATGLLGGESGYSLVTLLGVDLGIVGAALAPLLGIAVGVNLYETNPDFWTKLSQKLLPFCYPGTTEIPTWAEIVDSAWKTSIPKRILDAIKSLFEEEGIDPNNIYTETEKSYRGVSYKFAVPGVGNLWSTQTVPRTIVSEVNGNAALMLGIVGSVRILWCVGSPGSSIVLRREGSSGIEARLTPGSAYQGNIEAAYMYPENILSTISPDPTPNEVYLNGDQGPEVEHGMPEGLEKWGGTTPSEIPESRPAIIDENGTEEPMVPISLPEEVPSERPPATPINWPPNLPSPLTPPSPDPEVQPDPTIITDPQKQVEPYVMPSPIPWEIYAPDPSETPQTDPYLDPTTPRPPTQVITNPPISLDPPPAGISPWPVMPGTPMAFAQNVGLITVYHPTTDQLYAFERWLWVTLANADINTVWNNPFDGVIGLFELYCTPTDVGQRSIHSGFLDSGINSAIISRYTEINCGTIAIPEYYGNYLDYSPYSKAHVYLPFVGVQELNVDDIVGHAVNITYRIDEYNGSCIAMITVAKTTEVNGETVEYRNTMYQFNGNCAVDLPISGGSQASIKAGLMMANAYQMAANISAGANLLGGLGSLLTGNIGGALSGLGQAASAYAFGQANALSHMLSGKSTVQKSGQFGSSYGAMGIKNPFITIVRPKQIQVPNYNELYGYPAHKMVTIGSCTGFLRCREVHVTSPTASDEEKSIIESLLKSGVYVTE